MLSNSSLVRLWNEIKDAIPMFDETDSVNEMYVEHLHTPGAKDDADKPPVALLFESFPNALVEISKVAGYGTQKYTRDGWRKVADANIRYADAAARHELNRYIEGDFDEESGFLHLAHQAWNILALLELKLNE